MNLTGLQAQNLRAFPEASVDFPDTGIALIVGANNSGKSALLSALDAVARIAQFEAVRYAGADEPAQIEVTFSLTGNERRRVVTPTAGYINSWLETEAFKLVRWTFTQMPNAENLYASSLDAGGADGEMSRIAEVGPRAQGDFYLRSVNFAEALRDAPPRSQFELSAEQTGGV